MSDGVTLGTTLAFSLGAVAFIVYYGWRSRQRRRIEPMLVLALAMVPLFWLEAPGNWAFWVQYNPHFAHVPAWGPLGMTYGGLPLIAIPGYPFYYVPPMAIAVYVATRLRWPSRFTAAQRLLISGLVVGFIWDVPFEIIAIRLGIWRLAYSPWGLTLWGGSRFQSDIAVSLMIAIFCMFCTYLIGRTDDRGDMVLLGWAKRHTSSSRAAHLLHFAVVAVSFQIIYALSYVPIFVVHYLGLVTHQSSGPLFDDIPLQSTVGMGHGIVGFAILVGGAALQVWLIFALLNRLDAHLLGKSSPVQAESQVGASQA